MAIQDFISEQEATRLTGMSLSTLQRFAEAGYLQIEHDSDGLTLFSQEELAKIFGIRGNVAQRQEKQTATASTRPTTTAQQESPAKSSLVSQIEVVNESGSDTVNIAQNATTEAQATPSAPSAALVEEVQRLRQLVHLQERILDLKEQEVKDLREQRNWLQARVEKLEDKSDRDQVLILTESQTIKTLVSLQSQQKSSVRKALEWFGFAEPNQAGSNGEAIEIGKRRQE
jgi:hypothetical protein